jgi:hypothetical protein
MRDNDGSALRTAAQEPMAWGLSSAAWKPADKTAALTRVRYLERQLFDDSGRLRRGITQERADETVAVINHLRRALGWLEIDLDGQWRWPATSDRGESMSLLSAAGRGGRRRQVP